MSCDITAICTDGGFSDAGSGGITSGDVILKDPGVIITILDEAPNPARGVRVIATGAGQTLIALPSGGFEVSGDLQSGATYIFRAPANFVLTKTNSALLEVDQGTVQVVFEALDIVTTVEEGESIEVSEEPVP